MTIKEERAAGLDALKEIGTGGILYVVEVLNGYFRPVETFRCHALEDADRVYQGLIEHHHPAFVNKYAIVPLK